MIDWKNPKALISPNFTVHDATYLPSWQVYHSPSDDEKANILRTAAKLELVREWLEKPLLVHVWIRPISANCTGPFAGRNYNAIVGGALGSAHIRGEAVDFNPHSMTCDEARTLLLPKLEEFQIRMENRNGNWVHVDNRQPAPGGKRFFKP